MRSLTFSLFLITLISCGGGGVDDLNLETTSGSSGGGSSGSIEIEIVSVDPTSIDPAINNGEFTVNWRTTTDSDFYFLELVFSLDSTLTNDDAYIFFVECNDNFCEGISLDTSTSTYFTTCSFNNSNVMDCGFGFADLTSYISGLPQDGYLIIRACLDARFETCDNSSERITLR